MSATAKKSVVNSVPTARKKLLAAVQIAYKNANPYLDDQDELRAARLEFATKFLNLTKQCRSYSDLSDKQLGLLLDELRRTDGQASTKSTQNTTDLRNSKNSLNRFAARPRAVDQSSAPIGGADVIHLAQDAQIHTINKLVAFIGWTEQRFREFLFQKTNCHSRQMMTFKKANGFTMILLVIAARKSLVANGATGPISRQQINQHIPELKRKLGIDQH